ncbi:MAG: LysR family transcriptional regulator [Thermodesulfobacteriota bacterium]|nr:LysR family transcriptional regulator [Thermodesulfobacteriota bacterium]
MRINLNQLKSFFLAVREKSITKAAEFLYITQPAVTMQLKSLEQDLDLKLFRKFGKSFELTDVGEELFDYAARIFEIVEEMDYVLKGYSNLSLGSLTIGTTSNFARHLMPILLSDFQKRYPGVKISLKVGSSQKIADDVMAFKYNLGLIGKLPYQSKLNMIPYTKVEFCLVVPPQHKFTRRKKVSLKELVNESIIIREQGSGARYALLSLLSSYDIKPSLLVEAESVEFIKEYVINGHGISFLYKPEVQLEVKKGLLKSIDIEEGPVFVQTDIIFPEHVELSPPAQAFLQLIKNKA